MILLRRIERLLSEPIMGFLSLFALYLAVAPLVFDLTPRSRSGFEACEWGIVGAFAIEYLVKLGLSESKARFFVAPARMLDLLIILLPIASLGPLAPRAFRSSPVLRLLRVARAAVLGIRTTGAVAISGGQHGVDAGRAPFEIRGLVASRPGEIRTVSWDEFLRELSDPDEEWFYLSGVQPEDFGRISAALGLPTGFLWSRLVDGVYPRLDVIEGYLTVFVQYPKIRNMRGADGIELDRTGTLIIGTAQNLITIAREPRGLHERMLESLQGVDESAPFLVRVMYALLKHLCARYAEVIDAFEKEVVRLENQPVRSSSQGFLESSFQLKRQIAAATNSLWHFKEMVRAIAEKRVPLRGFDAKHQTTFEGLADEADYRYETATNVRESLISLIELHLNVVSFEMNNVMRILAIVTTVALVPSVVGGLLGMNLSEMPAVPFWQVVFGVGCGMSLCLYVFAVKGWLR